MRTLAAAIILAASPAFAESARAYQERLCAVMQTEVTLASGARVDCLNHEFAIEVDFSDKWHQAIGQSLYYAAETGRKPGVILICRKSDDTCLGHSLRLQTTIGAWNLPITVWQCESDALALSDCLRR